MGSLNDYDYYKAKSSSDKNSKKGGFGRRFLAQSVAAVILILLVFNFATADNPVGSFARYVVGEGLSLDSSWINYEQILQAAADKNSDVPEFVVPVSGVVTKKFQLQGEAEDQASGIIITADAGSPVKAVADGTILTAGGDSGDMWLTISHGGGFVSIYQGLESLSVREGQSVLSGEPIGLMGESELHFALKQNEEAIDPLFWLFKQDADDKNDISRPSETPSQQTI